MEQDIAQAKVNTYKDHHEFLWGTSWKPVLLELGEGEEMEATICCSRCLQLKCFSVCTPAGPPSRNHPHAELERWACKGHVYTT